MAVLIGTDPAKTPTLNLGIGGQNGFMPNPSQWVSNSPYVQPHTRCALLTAPKLFDYLNDPVAAYIALKSMIELLPQRVSGFNQTVTWDYDGPAVGNSGAKFEAPIKANRQQSQPVFEYSEKAGLAIARWWTEIGRLIILDPDLQHPGIVAAPKYIAAGSPPITPDMQSFTILAFEPDSTLTRVTKAWIVTNMMPRSGGDITGESERGGSMQTPVQSIEFTGYDQIGYAPELLAKAYLSTLALQDLRPTELSAITQGVDPTVAAAGLGLATAPTFAVMPPVATSPSAGS